MKLQFFLKYNKYNKIIYSNYFIHVLLFTTTLIYSLNYNLAKLIIPHSLKPIEYVITRTIPTAILLWGFSFILVKEKIKNSSDYLKLYLCSLFGMVINQISFYEGLALINPINASLLATTTPIFVLIFSCTISKERLSYSKVIGIILAATGAISLIIMNGVSFSNTSFLGSLYILLDAVSFAIYLIFVKQLTKAYHPFTIMKWIFTFGGITLLVLAPFDINKVIQAITDINLLMILIFIVFFGTFFVYLVEVMVLKKVNPSMVGVYIYLQPIFTTIIAISAGNEALTTIQILGAILILAGIYIVSKKQIDCFKN